jgi:peroxiredoxin
LPSIHRVHERLKDTGLAVLLVDFEEPPALVRRVVAERGYTLPVLLDRGGAVKRRYGVFGPPAVFLIDREGNLLAKAFGPKDWESPEGIRLLEELAR